MVDTHQVKPSNQANKEMKGFPMIEVKLPALTIGLGFRHPATIVPLEKVKDDGPTHRKIRSTICQVYELIHTDTSIKPFAILLGEGEAVCGKFSPSEQFNKERGRKLALTKALARTALTKNERAAVWEGYRNR